MLRKSLMNCVVAVLAVLFAVVATPRLPYPRHSTAAASDAVAEKAKTVTVFADIETEAVAQGQRQQGLEGNIGEKGQQSPSLCMASHPAKG